MTTETIDHGTLSRLVEADVVSAAHVVGRDGGWALSVKYGVAERFLAAQRSGKVRLFRRLESVTSYLKDLGVDRFEVDASSFDAAASQTRKRPDRAAALKRAHKAAEHDAWFREQVQQALDDADKPGAVFIPHEEVMAELKAQLDALAARAGKGV